MKAVINLSCEMEDIPQTVGDFLNLIHSRKWKTVEELLNLASNACSQNMSMEALDKIDGLRRLLGQIDNQLLDYSTILNGYIKAQADLKAGILPEQQPQPEIEINDIDEKKEQPESD